MAQDDGPSAAQNLTNRNNPKVSVPLEPLSRPGLQSTPMPDAVEPGGRKIGLVIAAGVLEALFAGAVQWRWFTVIAGVLVWMIGFAILMPRPFLLQKQRGGLPAFLINLFLVLSMACGLLFGLGRLGALALR